MPKIRFTRRFIQSFARLPAAVQEKIKKEIALLAENPRHPSLQTRSIQGAPGIYETRVDVDYRMTYEREADDTLVLRVVGKDDKVLKNPLSTGLPKKNWTAPLTQWLKTHCNSSTVACVGNSQTWHVPIIMEEGFNNQRLNHPSCPSRSSAKGASSKSCSLGLFTWRV